MRRFEVFTKLPPKDLSAEDAQLPHVGEYELGIDGAWLGAKYDHYSRSKNIVYALEAFILARQLGVYPPPWVIDALAHRFEKWHTGQGLESMDVVLGLRAKGRGRRDPAFAKLRYEERDEMLSLDCARLVALGATVDAAAAAVAERLKATKGWDKSGWKLRPLDEDQVKKRYQALSKDIKRWIAKAVKAWPAKQRDAYLQLFPCTAKTLFSRSSRR